MSACIECGGTAANVDQLRAPVVDGPYCVDCVTRYVAALWGPENAAASRRALEELRGAA